MQFKIDGVELPVYPSEFNADIMDLDNAETTERTLDGTLHRDRIAVKRQHQLKFNAMKWSDLSTILQMISPEWIDVTYPDPQTGQHETKKFYVGNRTSAVAVEKGSVIWWKGLSFTITER